MRCGYGMAGGYFTDVMLHSSRNYHQVRATELRRLSKDVAVDGGAVILRFDGVSLNVIVYQWSVVVVICGSCELERRVESVVIWARIRL